MDVTVLSEKEVSEIITKRQEENRKKRAEFLNPEIYLYKGKSLNLDISLDLDDIKKHPENTFFEIDNNIIIILDRFRRCWNSWIKGKNPIGEWKTNNDELIELLPTLSVVERGNLHNQLADKLYLMSLKSCRYWTKFLHGLDVFEYDEVNKLSYGLLSDFSKLFYNSCFYLLHIDIDK